jgi:tetratricopeptide (TPR) repeat protein
MKRGFWILAIGFLWALSAAAAADDIALAREAYRAGDFRTAVVHYERIVPSQRSPVETLALARSYRMLQQFDRAKQLAEHELAKSPRNTEALVLTGDIAAAQEDWDAAAKAYAAATASDSPRPEIWLRLGQALQHTGHPQLAEFAFATYQQSMGQ